MVGTTRCVGYVRVSTHEQAERGISLEAQATAISRFAAQRGWSLVGMIEDAAQSGTKADRPGLTRLKDMVAHGEADAVVVTRLDRLGRSVLDTLSLIEELAVGGAQIVSITESIDATTATGRLIVTVLIGLAEWERRTMSDRTKAALAHVKAQGRHVGRVPFGKRKDGAGRLVDHRKEMLTLRRARYMRQRGVTIRRIADEFGWSFGAAWDRVHSVGSQDGRGVRR